MRLGGTQGRGAANRVTTAWVLTLAVILPALGCADAPLSAADLDRMSIEDLARLEIWPAPKTAQPSAASAGQSFDFAPPRGS